MVYLLNFSFFFACLLAVCGNNPAGTENPALPTPTEKADLSLTMSRSACYGTCPVYELKVEPDGKVVFDGQKFTGTKGKAESKLSEEKLKQLVSEINSSGFFSLKDDYTENSGNCPQVETDNSTVKISVKLGGKEKTITHYLGCSGNSEVEKLSKLENKIDEIAETKRWIAEKR